MGLDCYPHRYPCVSQGTAVYDDERIDCDATQAAHGCPWQTAMVGRGTPVVGMFGTDCWYRGKAGEYMLGDLRAGGYEPPVEGGFYGDDDADPNLSPEHCVTLGRWMVEHVEAYAAEVARQPTADVKTAVEQYRYAAFWLRWVGENCSGAKAWW